MTAFAQALALTLRFEGGYVDDPADHGGATNQGITQRVYDHYRNGLNLPTRSVRDIAPTEVQAIYEYMYWIPAHCDALPSALAIVQFDTAVNMGVGRAIKILQAAVEVAPDGLWGPATAAAVASAPMPDTVAVYLDGRIARYHEIVGADPSQGKFLTGWLKRVEQLRQAVA